MANFNEHLEKGAMTGAVIGALINIYQQVDKISNEPEYKFDIAELLKTTAIGAGVGAIGGTLPDILEPATNPNHRQFFHSLTMAATLGYAAYKANQSTSLTKEDKLLVTTSVAAYFSHLALDSETPKSLPTI